MTFGVQHAQKSWFSPWKMMVGKPISFLLGPGTLPEMKPAILHLKIGWFGWLPSLLGGKRPIFTRMSQEVRINGLFHLLIDGVYWGYNPLILTIDPNFLGRPSNIPLDFLQVHLFQGVSWVNNPLARMLARHHQDYSINRIGNPYMGVSKNSGTPKWMVYNGKPY